MIDLWIVDQQVQKFEREDIAWTKVVDIKDGFITTERSVAPNDTMVLGSAEHFKMLSVGDSVLVLATKLGDVCIGKWCGRQV